MVSVRDCAATYYPVATLGSWTPRGISFLVRMAWCFSPGIDMMREESTLPLLRHPLCLMVTLEMNREQEIEQADHDVYKVPRYRA